LMDFRNCFGMMASVSTLARSSGATRPFSTVNFSMGLAPAPHVDEMAGDRRRGRHRRADEVRAPARALPPLEVAIRGGRAALAGLEAVGVHRQAHRAAGLAPFETRFAEHLVQTFPF